MAKSENPLITAQKNAIEAASNNLVVQKSRYLPVIELQLNYYDTDTGYQNTQTSQTQTQVAAINVNVPIFTGGTTTHRMFGTKPTHHQSGRKRSQNSRHS